MLHFVYLFYFGKIFFDNVETRVNMQLEISKTFLELFKAPLHLFKAFIHLFKAFVYLFKAFVYSQKAFCGNERKLINFIAHNAPDLIEILLGECHRIKDGALTS